MADFTNKTLAYILIGAVAVSLFGAILSLNKLNTITGFATNVQGTAQLTLNTTTSIVFTDSSVDWSSGYVNSTGAAQNCTLDTSGSGSKSTDCVGFSGYTDTGMVLENDGNTYVNITLASDKLAATFIGGGADHGGPQYLWQVIATGEAGSCLSLPLSAYSSVATSATLACTNLSYADTNDTIRINLKVNIPLSATSGAKTSQLTAVATSIQ